MDLDLKDLAFHTGKKRWLASHGTAKASLLDSLMLKMNYGSYSSHYPSIGNEAILLGRQNHVEWDCALRNSEVYGK